MIVLSNLYFLIPYFGVTLFSIVGTLIFFFIYCFDTCLDIPCKVNWIGGIDKLILDRTTYVCIYISNPALRALNFLVKCFAFLSICH